LPLARVSGELSAGKIVSAVLLAEGFLRTRAGIRAPRVAVCALNPHAGEGGLLGAEEKRVILPAVRAVQKRGICAEGPLPCDSAWLKMKNGRYDLLVAMYHDQTMTGLKCLAPEKIVNVTVGLPFIRTSPGHGTAFDIAGKGRADARPMIEAIKAAAAFVRDP
ncbi:MAG: PdxA family dehydrogenase, partial [Endomicrobiales bacterium]